MASGNPNEKVWGVGIHEDVVQASLIALLSAASSFLTSRASTPFKPKHTKNFSASELHALEQLNLGGDSPLRGTIIPNDFGGSNGSASKSGRVNLEKMELEAAQAAEVQAKVNGSY